MVAREKPKNNFVAKVQLTKMQLFWELSHVNLTEFLRKGFRNIVFVKGPFFHYQVVLSGTTYKTFFYEYNLFCPM